MKPALACASWVTAVVAALVMSGAGCGGADPVDAESPPPSVPETVVPAALSDGSIRLYENVDDETLQAFANGGESTLVADGRLWELRQDARLIGALQVSTVVDRIDLADEQDRRSILRQVLPGNLNQLVIEEVPVWAAAANDKVVYMWFATDMFQVLQLKGSQLQPEKLLGEVVAFQRASEDWLPLPPESYDEGL